MRYDNDAAALAVEAKFFEACEVPLEALANALAAGYRMVDVFRFVFGVRSRVDQASLGTRQTLENPVVSFSQACVRLDRMPRAAGNDFGGRAGAPEVAAHQAVERFACQSLRDAFGLRHTLLIEWAVEVALDSAEPIPV